MTEVISDRLVFPEGLRWHDGSLWLSDIHAHTIVRLSEDGQQTVVAEIADRPSGLGFLADRALLVVSLIDRQLLVHRDGETRMLADLAPYCDKLANDMATDGLGRSWVACRSHGTPGDPTDCVVRVDPDGTATVAADSLVTPNGIAVTHDLERLVVAESHACRITWFDIASDGTLQGRSDPIQLDSEPDGLCLDADGGVWIAMPQQSRVVHLDSRGVMDRQVPVPDLWPFTCTLGGADRRTLYVAAGATTMANFERLGLDRDLDATSTARGWVLRTERVDVPGAGWP